MSDHFTFFVRKTLDFLIGSNRVFCREADSRLADIFVKKGPFLKMYTEYIREFETMVSVLDDTRRKNPEFDKIVTDFEVEINYLLNFILCDYCYIMCLFKHMVY